MTAKFKRCPAGLTIDAYVEGSIVKFRCVTKKYGYDTHVTGFPDEAFDDYVITDKNISPDIEQFLLEYLKDNDPELYNDITSKPHSV